MIARLRDALVRVYRNRGGGFYAAGYVVSFLALEVRTVSREFLASDSLSAFVSEQALEAVLRFVGASLANSIKAFLWPLLAIEALRPAIGVATIGVGFPIFDRYLRPRLDGVIARIARGPGA